MENDIITDFNNWTYSLPQQPQDKDYQKLADKLKTYVTSTKFMRQGSTVDQYDPQTGRRIKRPVFDVVYRQNPDAQGISSQQLRQKIYKAINTKNQDLLQDVAKYRYFSARRAPLKQQLDRKLQQEQKERQRRRRRRVIIQATVLGGAGAALGLIPYIKDKQYGQRFTMGELKKSLALSAAGIGTGILATGVIEAARGD